MGMEISPMSDLANNLSSSSLSPSPWLMKGKVGPSASKAMLSLCFFQPKKLAFALESSPEDNSDSPISYSAAKTSVMDSSIDSNGNNKINVKRTARFINTVQPLLHPWGPF